MPGMSKLATSQPGTTCVAMRVQICLRCALGTSRMRSLTDWPWLPVSSSVSSTSAARVPSSTMSTLCRSPARSASAQSGISIHSRLEVENALAFGASSIVVP
jgi:hypothetical protein